MMENYEKVEEGTLKTLRLMWDLAELEVFTEEIRIYLGSVVAALSEVMLYSEPDRFGDFLEKVRDEFAPRRESQLDRQVAEETRGIDDFLSKLLDES